MLMVKYLYRGKGACQKGNINRRKKVKKGEVGFWVTEEYKVWINDIKKRIKQSHTLFSMSEQLAAMTRVGNFKFPTAIKAI